MTPPPSIPSLVFVRLFRVWAAAREKGENPLPHLNQAVPLFAPTPELAVACASLFDLVEAQLGRRLFPECCCSAELSRDEEALLGVLHYAPEAAQPFASEAMPHGLPGAIGWAAFAVRRALARSCGEPVEAATAPAADPTAGCPFGVPPPRVVASAPRTAGIGGTN